MYICPIENEGFSHVILVFSGLHPQSVRDDLLTTHPAGVMEAEPTEQLATWVFHDSFGPTWQLVDYLEWVNGSVLKQVYVKVVNWVVHWIYFQLYMNSILTVCALKASTYFWRTFFTKKCQSTASCFVLPQNPWVNKTIVGELWIIFGVFGSMAAPIFCPNGSNFGPLPVGAFRRSKFRWAHFSERSWIGITKRHAPGLLSWKMKGGWVMSKWEL